MKIRLSNPDRIRPIERIKTEGPVAASVLLAALGIKIGYDRATSPEQINNSTNVNAKKALLKNSGAQAKKQVSNRQAIGDLLQGGVVCKITSPGFTNYNKEFESLLLEMHEKNLELNYKYDDLIVDLEKEYKPRFQSINAIDEDAKIIWQTNQAMINLNSEANQKRSLLSVQRNEEQQTLFKQYRNKVIALKKNYPVFYTLKNLIVSSKANFSELMPFLLAQEYGQGVVAVNLVSTKGMVCNYINDDTNYEFKFGTTKAYRLSFAFDGQVFSSIIVCEKNKEPYLINFVDSEMERSAFKHPDLNVEEEINYVNRSKIRDLMPPSQKILQTVKQKINIGDKIYKANVYIVGTNLRNINDIYVYYPDMNKLQKADFARTDSKPYCWVKNPRMEGANPKLMQLNAGSMSRLDLPILFHDFMRLEEKPVYPEALIKADPKKVNSKTAGSIKVGISDLFEDFSSKLPDSIKTSKYRTYASLKATINTNAHAKIIDAQKKLVHKLIALRGIYLAKFKKFGAYDPKTDELTVTQKGKTAQIKRLLAEVKKKADKAVEVYYEKEAYYNNGAIEEIANLNFEDVKQGYKDLEILTSKVKESVDFALLEKSISLDILSNNGMPLEQHTSDADPRFINDNGKVLVMLRNIETSFNTVEKSYVCAFAINGGKNVLFTMPFTNLAKSVGNKAPSNLPTICKGVAALAGILKQGDGPLSVIPVTLTHHGGDKAWVIISGDESTRKPSAVYLYRPKINKMLQLNFKADLYSKQMNQYGFNLGLEGKDKKVINFHYLAQAYDPVIDNNPLHGITTVEIDEGDGK